MTNVGEGGINIEKVRINIEKVWIKDENVELKKVARRGLQVCKAKKTYRKDMEMLFYNIDENFGESLLFRDLWRIPECKSL